MRKRRKSGAINTKLFGYVWKKSDMTRTLDGYGQLPLMSSAYTGHATRQDLGAFRKKSAQSRNILVVDMLYLINTECTDFSALTTTMRSICCHYIRLLFIKF
jgi:hypothetical protein